MSLLRPRALLVASFMMACTLMTVADAWAQHGQVGDGSGDGAPGAPTDGPLHLTPELLLERVDAMSPMISIAELEAQSATWRRVEARYAAYPSFSVRAGVAPAPRISVDLNEDGQPILSQDSRTEAELLSDIVSLGYSADLTVTVPLTTFGRIRVARQLADVGVDVAELRVEAARAESRFEAWRALLVLQWYRPVSQLLREAEGRLDEAEEELEWQIDDGEFALRSTLRELIIGRTQFVELRTEADSVARLARHAMQVSLGLPAGFTVDAIDDTVPRDEPPSLDEVLAVARAHRIDLRMLDAAVDAAMLQVRMRRREFAPSLGFVADVSARYAPTVTDLSGPFVYDPYNRFSPGLAIGLQWNVNVFTQVARLHRAESQLAVAEASQDAAWLGIQLEIAEAYFDATGAREVFASYADAIRSAEAELNQTTFQYDQGLADFDDLSGPLRTYYETAGEYWKAVLDYRIALASLALACGAEDLSGWPAP